MIARSLIVSVVAFFSVAASVAHAQVKAKDTSLQAAIDARQKAIDGRNAPEWGKYTADEFVLITADGTMQSRSERMKLLATNNNKPNPVTIDRITMFGPDAAVVTQHNPTSQNTLTRITTFWVRQGDTWKVTTTVFSPYKK
jgi:hypothetical protein